MYVIFVNYYLFGVFYLCGGVSEIVFYIILVIEKVGGKVLVRVRVFKIFVEEVFGKV